MLVVLIGSVLWQLDYLSLLKNCLNRKNFDYLLFLCIAGTLHGNFILEFEI